MNRKAGDNVFAHIFFQASVIARNLPHVHIDGKGYDSDFAGTINLQLILLFSSGLDSGFIEDAGFNK